MSVALGWLAGRFSVDEEKRMEGPCWDHAMGTWVGLGFRETPRMYLTSDCFCLVGPLLHPSKVAVHSGSPARTSLRRQGRMMEYSIQVCSEATTGRAQSYPESPQGTPILQIAPGGVASLLPRPADLAHARYNMNTIRCIKRENMLQAPCSMMDACLGRRSDRADCLIHLFC
jgi:hypothetical protein